MIADAIAHLRALGVPIGSSPAGGTLLVDFSNLSLASDAAVTLRVTTPVEEGGGRAGLSYYGVDPAGLLTGPRIRHRPAPEQPGPLQRSGSERGRHR